MVFALSQSKLNSITNRKSQPQALVSETKQSLISGVGLAKILRAVLVIPNQDSFAVGDLGFNHWPSAVIKNPI